MFMHVCILEVAEDMKVERKWGGGGTIAVCVCNGTTRGIWEHTPTAKVFNQMLSDCFWGTFGWRITNRISSHMHLLFFSSCLLLIPILPLPHSHYPPPMLFIYLPSPSSPLPLSPPFSLLFFPFTSSYNQLIMCTLHLMVHSFNVNLSFLTSPSVSLNVVSIVKSVVQLY